MIGIRSKLEKLRAAAGDLGKIVLQMPAKATSFALIAFDPDAPADDPAIREVGEVLKAQWKTYANAFPETPVTVFRAMLLEALCQAAADDDRIGAVFVALARNLLPVTEGGNEQVIWAEVVSEVERRINTRAETEWATPSSIKSPPLAFEMPEEAVVEISREEVSVEKLQKQIWAAAGPGGGDTDLERNGYWTNSNSSWVTEFGTRMATAISQAIDSAVNSIAVSEVDLAGPLRQLSSAVSNHVEAALQSISGATAGLQRRTNLLWWKEALYSPSARISYRKPPVPVAAALMAFDLHRLVPTFSPASVSAFLHEAVLCLPAGEADKTLTLRELLESITVTEEAKALRQAASELVPAPVGRGPLLGLIGHWDARNVIDDQEFRRLFGVPADTALTLPAWAAWIFRELQALRAIREAAVEKTAADGN